MNCEDGAVPGQFTEHTQYSYLDIRLQKKKAAFASNTLSI